MFKKILHSPITWVLALVAIFFIMRKTGTGSILGIGSVDPAHVDRVPPPGYSGPAGGPFTWGGIGSPPDGEYQVIGNPAT